MISTEVLVIGAGPAGIAAATAAAEHSSQVIVLDDNRHAGGQIWRDATTSHLPSAQVRDPQKTHALERLRRSGAQLLVGHCVFNVCAPKIVETVEETASISRTQQFHFEQLILATGARERFLPFPGWTLPGVFGAGGLQALVRGGYSVEGKRIVVAGTGPLLFAVAAHLAQDGARVSSIVEQAKFGQLAAFSASLWRQPAKLIQGARYRASLRSTFYRTSCWVVEAIAAEDGETLAAVRITDGKRTWAEPCDLLACGYHLVPNTEIAELLGCAFQDSVVQVDERQRTSVPNVFCAGEPTGIAGLDAARVQGEIAGLACTGKSSAALQRLAAKERTFAKSLERTFTLRDELRSLPQSDTILCRCEDVTFASVQRYAGWSDTKLQTRCGMGPCQGRICGPAVEYILGWRPTSVRQPLYPVRLHALCSVGEPALNEATAEIK